MGRVSARMSGAWVRMGVPSVPMGVLGLRMSDASVRMEALWALTGDASGADERRGGADEAAGMGGLRIVDCRFLMVDWRKGGGGGHRALAGVRRRCGGRIGRAARAPLFSPDP